MYTFIEQNKGLVKLVVIAGALFLLFAAIGKAKEYRFIGSGLNATNTITVNGEGKVDRAPDTAKVTFSVRNESKDLKTAQGTVSTKIEAITTALKDLGIEEKYIKTDSYNSYPQYTYPQSICYGGSCPTPSPTVRGYEVSHMITVSIKNLDAVNDVLGALGSAGVTDLSGPNFGFEDDDAIAREARALAIADAKAEAKILAKALGVRLVRIVSFSEGSGYNPMYARMESQAADADQKAVAPVLPIGDQTMQSTVTVVYEIR